MQQRRSAHFVKILWEQTCEPLVAARHARETVSNWEEKRRAAVTTSDVPASCRTALAVYKKTHTQNTNESQTSFRSKRNPLDGSGYPF